MASLEVRGLVRRRMFAKVADLALISFLVWAYSELLNGVVFPAILSIYLASLTPAQFASVEDLYVWIVLFAGLAFALPFVYFGYLESRGRVSLGKRMFGLSVRTTSGDLPSFSQAIKRNILFAFFGFLGALIEAFSLSSAADGRRWGDKWADTIVVDSKIPVSAGQPSGGPAPN